MKGLMADEPLLVSSLLTYAERLHGRVEIASRTVEGPVRHCSWRDVARRSRQLANALTRLGVREGDRVGTLAWNGYRHLELYYGVAGMGAVIHTLNPRLHPSQLTYIVNHAEDRILFVDLTFVPLIEAVADRLGDVESIVVMTDRDHMPSSSLDLLCYEELLDAADEDFTWPELDDDAAAGICYTSGTTGNPKGVVYTHRSIILHSYAIALPVGLSLTQDETVLLVVPMFHVNGWGIPWAAAITGCRLVLPGPRMDGPGLTELMNAESVTYYAGVPTIHMALLAHWKESGESVPSLRQAACGGSALTRTIMDGYWAHGIDVTQGWGMTETSPVVTFSKLDPAQKNLSDDEKAEILARQGKPLFGTELRIVDEGGRRLPEDGEAIGEVQVRGPWICSAYLGESPGSRLVDDGWFPTGDVGKIHPDATLQLTDRLKDLIKSGGEWISSIDLESIAMRHPEVNMAAVIAVPSEQWDERPLLIVVPEPGTSPSRSSVLEFLEGQVAKWWLPDDVIFVKDLPLGATGKVQKAKLREQYGNG